MKIVTSSWFTALPPGMVRVGISRGVPRVGTGPYRMMRQLAPGAWFKSVTVEEYAQRYADEILAPLDPAVTVASLLLLGGGRDVALLCFESPDDPEAWCHRGLVSAWLADTVGVVVPEYGLEQLGHGWSHPKLHASLRRDFPSLNTETDLGR